MKKFLAALLSLAMVAGLFALSLSPATAATGPTEAPQGDWVGTHGADGHYLSAFNSSAPAGDVNGLTNVTLSTSGLGRHRYGASTDVRALESPDELSRAAGVFYTSSSNTGTISLNFSTAFAGDLKIYAIDWDTTTRRQTIMVNDNDSANETVTYDAAFNNGGWASFPIAADAGETVVVTVTRTAGANAVVSGVFLDGTFSTVQAPGAPTALGATAGDDQVALSWTAPTTGDPVADYHVYRNTVADFGTATELTTPVSTATTFTDTTADNGTTYHYWVTASNAGGESGESNSASATPDGPLSAPQGDWVGNFGAQGHYLASFNSATLAGDVNGLSSVNLTTSGLSRWRYGTTTDVRALEAADELSRAAGILYTTSTGTISLEFTSAYVGDLSLYAVDWDTTARRQTITVNDGAAQVQTYESAFNEGAWATFAIDASEGETVTVGLAKDAGHSAVVSGLFLDGAFTGVTPPGAPADLMATAGDNKVDLSWTAPTTGDPVTDYNVLRNTVLDLGTASEVPTPVSTATTFSDTTVDPGTTYHYWVTAENGGGTGPASNSASATPTGLESAPQGDWVGNFGANGHYLAAFNGNTLAGDVNGLSGVSLSTSGLARHRYGATTSVRALEAPDELTRAAGVFYTNTSATGTISLSFSSAFAGDLSFYAVDWDGTSRRQTITVNDGTEQVVTYGSSFNDGAWATFAIDASAGEVVTLTLTRTAGANAVVSGLFLDGTFTGVTPPGAPSGLMATAGDDQVELTWLAPGTGDAPSDYHVYRNTVADFGTATELTTPVSTATTFTDTTADNGTTYHYWVTASNAGGESGESNSASATPDGPVSAPQGDWVGVHGADGHYLAAFNSATLAGDVNGLTGVNLTTSGLNRWRYGATTDVRALEAPDELSRAAGIFYTASTGTVSLEFTSAYAGDLHLYAIDWDTTARRQTITVNDGAEQVQTYESAFNEGAWATFAINADAGETVTVALARTAGHSAVLSGLFLDGTFTGVTPPGAPTGLMATAGDSKVDLSWTAPTTGDAPTDYKVYRSLDNLFANAAEVTSPVSTDTTFTDTTAQSGTSYHYWVTALNTGGESGPSNAAGPVVPTGLPSAPQGDWVGNFGADGHYLAAFNGATLAGDVNGLSGVSLSTSGLARHRYGATTDVRALEAPDELTRAAGVFYTGSTGTVSLSFSSAYVGDLSFYAVDWDTTTRRQTITVNDGTEQVVTYGSSFNNGAWATVAIDADAGEVVTLTLTRTAGANAQLSGLFLDGTFTVVTPPGAPSGLMATAGDDQVELTWLAPGTGDAPSDYHVYRNTVADFGTATELTTPVSTATTFTDTTADNGTTYHYWVTASNGGGESGESNSASATPDGPVSAPQGDWVGNFGADGHYLPSFTSATVGGDVNGLPAGVTLGTSGLSRFNYGTGLSDLRALESADESTRAAGVFYTSSSNTGTISLTFTDAFVGDLSLYAVDWDGTGRRQTVTVNDGADQVQTYESAFNEGAWATFAIDAGAGETVTITVTRTAGANAQISGLFLDAATP